MPIFIEGETYTLDEKQIEMLDWFQKNPPKYYKWFYKFYTKWIGNVIFFSIVAAGALMIIFNDAVFDVVKGIFFFVFGLGLWALSAFLYKHFYTKRYAKKMGLSLKVFNMFAMGLEWDI